MRWVFLLIAIFAEVAGTSALKAAEGFTRLVPSAVVVVGYAASFYFLSLTLDTIPVGVAYAVWSGVGLVLISILGVFLYHQKLDAPALLGMALIGIGIVVINAFSTSVSHQ